MSFQSDNFYLEKVLNNDVKAYASLVDKHKDMVFTVALRIVKNRQDAEEIAQDAFVKAYESLTTFKKEAKFSTWLYRIVYNTAISKMRKKDLNTVDLDYDIVENYSENEMIEDLNRLDEDEQRKVINNILKKLNPEENMLISLYYYKAYSIEEIADIVSLSQSNVKVKLHRIRKKLFNEIQKLLDTRQKEIYL